jgi:hypothetical protein
VRDVDFEAFAHQVARHHVGECHIVVDDQYAGLRLSVQRYRIARESRPRYSGRRKFLVS